MCTVLAGAPQPHTEIYLSASKTKSVLRNDNTKKVEQAQHLAKVQKWSHIITTKAGEERKISRLIKYRKYWKLYPANRKEGIPEQLKLILNISISFQLCRKKILQESRTGECLSKTLPPIKDNPNIKLGSRLLCQKGMVLLGEKLGLLNRAHSWAHPVYHLCPVR